MDDLISRKDALEAIACVTPWCNVSYLQDAIAAVKAIPPVAAEPVRHGEWMGSWNPGLFDIPRHCTICGFDNTNHGCVDFKHCPGCGARMDTEKDAEQFVDTNKTSDAKEDSNEQNPGNP